MFFKGVFGIIDVKENAQQIEITGLSSGALSNLLEKVWKTSVITKYFFNKFGRSGIAFPKFFAVEFLYIIDRLLTDKKARGVPYKSLRQVKKLLLEKTYLKHTQEGAKLSTRLNENQLKLFKLKPLQHQLDFLNEYGKKVEQYSLNGYLLFGTVGSGKTITTLMLSEMTESKYTIVICPKIVLHKAWASDINKAYIRPPKYWMSDSGLAIKGDEKILLCHYEYMPKLIPQLKYLKGDVTIILDECHNLNDPKSQRTQLFWDICRLTKSRNIIPMSGTPIKAMGSELMSVLTSIDPLFTADVRERFIKIFGTTNKKANDIVAHRLGIITYRMENKALTLNEPILENINIQIPEGNEFTLKEIARKMMVFTEERKEYYKRHMSAFEDVFSKGLTDALENNKQGTEAIKRYKDTLVPKVSRAQGSYIVKDEVAECKRIENQEIIPYLKSISKKEFVEAATVVKYVTLKIQGECLGRVVGRARIDAHVAMTKAVPFLDIIDQAEKKTVVFTTFVEVVEEANRICRELRLNPVSVYAKFATQTNTIITEFDRNPSADPLIATFASLSTGVPLVMANTIIMINTPFRPYIQEQAIGRVHRIGQDVQTKIYTCILDTGEEPNISSRGIDIIAWAQENVETITGVKSPYSLKNDESGLSVSNEDYDIEIPMDKVLNPNAASWSIL